MRTWRRASVSAISGPVSHAAFDRSGEAGPELGPPPRLVGDLVDAAQWHGLNVLPELALLNGGRPEPLHELRTVFAVGERPVVVAHQPHARARRARQERQCGRGWVVRGPAVARRPVRAAQLVAHAAHGLR